jgi:hypothetical protein
MAETVTRSLPAPFIEAAGKTYLDELTKTVGGIKGIDLSKLYGSTICCWTRSITNSSRRIIYWFRWLINLSYKQLKLQQVLLHINNTCLRISKM